MTDEKLPTRLLTRGQAAAYLGISVRTFQRHVLPSIGKVMIGTVARFVVEDLEAWIAAHHVDATEDPRRLTLYQRDGAMVTVKTVRRGAPIPLSPRERSILDRLRSPRAPGDRRRGAEESAALEEARERVREITRRAAQTQTRRKA